MPEYRTVTTYYHTAPRSPLAEPVLVTDVRRRFLNTCVLSEVVPGYAPGGMALIATSVRGQDHGGREAEVRGALAEVYGTDTGAWQPADRRCPTRRRRCRPHSRSAGARVGRRRYVCGRSTAPPAPSRGPGLGGPRGPRGGPGPWRHSHPWAARRVRRRWGRRRSGTRALGEPGADQGGERGAAAQAPEGDHRVADRAAERRVRGERDDLGTRR